MSIITIAYISRLDNSSTSSGRPLPVRGRAFSRVTLIPAAVAVVQVVSKAGFSGFVHPLGDRTESLRVAFGGLDYCLRPNVGRTQSIHCLGDFRRLSSPLKNFQRRLSSFLGAIQVLVLRGLPRPSAPSQLPVPAVPAVRLAPRTEPLRRTYRGALPEGAAHFLCTSDAQSGRTSFDLLV